MIYPDISHHSAVVQDSINIWRDRRVMEDAIVYHLFLAVPESVIDTLQEILANLERKQRVADNLADKEREQKGIKRA